MSVVLLLYSCSKKAVRSDFEPNREYKRALALIEDKKYEEARNILIEIKNRDSSTHYAPIAQFKIADSHLKEEEYDLAIDEYRRFIEQYPNNQSAFNAQYQIATIYYDQIEGADRGYQPARDALIEFNRLNKMYPRNPYREILPLRINKCKSVLAEHEFYVGKFYYRTGSYKAATGRFIDILKNYNTYEKTHEVYYFMGMSYKNLGQLRKAEEFFQKTLTASKNEKIFKKARKELNKLKNNDR